MQIRRRMALSLSKCVIIPLQIHSSLYFGDRRFGVLLVTNRPGAFLLRIWRAWKISMRYTTTLRFWISRATCSQVSGGGFIVTVEMPISSVWQDLYTEWCGDVASSMYHIKKYEPILSSYWLLFSHGTERIINEDLVRSSMCSAGWWPTCWCLSLQLLEYDRSGTRSWGRCSRVLLRKMAFVSIPFHFAESR